MADLTGQLQAAAGSAGGGGWDISTAVYEPSGFSVTGQQLNPMQVVFKTDGTKMYVVGFTSSLVSEYSLSTAWDAYSASHTQDFSLSGKDNFPYGLFFKTDGTQFYFIGGTSGSIHQYSLSTAWDVSTATFVRSFSVSARDTGASNLFFKDDGTKMYFGGYTNDKVYEYDLSTAWNISTASFVQDFSVSSKETTETGVFFKPDGTKMYIVGQSSDAIHEYDLSTAWNISTASFVQSFSVNSEDTVPSSIFFKDDGKRFYVTGRTNDKVYQYNLD